MLTSTTHHGIFVLDQDQAVDFYVGKLGMQVTADVDLGVMRWLTVAVPGDDRHVLLEKPGPPSMDDATAAQVADLVSKGASGLALILSTDDAQATFADLEAKGVDIVEEPVDRPYGIDFAIRDPFGNHIRISEPKDVSAEQVKQEYERGRS
jgi:catechol 2,3-dioxygenase-like lactoylglutathione lyase family enzyme